MTEHTDGPTAAAADTAETGPRFDAPAARRHRPLIGPFTARQIGLINAIVFGTALLLFLVTRPIGGGASPAVDPGATFYRLSAETQGLDIGQRAPELAGQDGDRQIQLADLDGRPLSLAALRGRPVWINFWATWCPPCQRETPDLRDAYDAHNAEGLVLIAIDVQEDVESVRDYAARYELRYPIGLDTYAAIMRTYRVFGLPTHYFIDRQGVIRDRYFGPLNRQQIEQRLTLILKP
jgi:thiol-disulfide isomerase/thioredoxin